MTAYSDLSDDAEHRTLEQFVELCNIIEPDHYYADNSKKYYDSTETICPLSCDDVDYSYTRRLHVHARCGPRYGYVFDASLTINANKWTDFTQSKQLVILLHEMTHLRYFGHGDDTGGAHSRNFWNQFAFYCMTALDKWSTVTALFPDATVDDFKHEAVHDVNSNVLDERQLTVDEGQSMIREYLDGYQPGTRFVRVDTNQPLAADK